MCIYIPNYTHSILLQVQLSHNKSKVVNSKLKRPKLEKIAKKTTQTKVQVIPCSHLQQLDQ